MKQFGLVAIVAFYSVNTYTLSNGEMTEMAEGARLLSECTG